MKISQMIPQTAGVDDPRERRTLTPTSVVKTWGDADGALHLTERKSVQTAICPHSDACVLRNSAEGERAAVLVDFGVEIHGSLCVSLWNITPRGGTVDLRVRLG